MHINQNSQLHKPSSIAILAAMDEEISEIKAALASVDQSEIFGYEIFAGYLENQHIVIIKSKIGKVNSSNAVNVIISHFNISKVINIGSAGSLSDSLNIFDIVVANKVAYHDVDLTGFNYEYGQLPNSPAYFTTHIPEFKQNNLNYKIGMVVSGDQFINDINDKALIIDHFSDAICVDMESASIAHTCHIYNKPLIVIKSISDKANNDSHLDFDNYIVKASSNLLAALVNSMNQ